MQQSATLPPEDEVLKYCEKLLRLHARRLNAVRWRIPFLPPSYDICSKSLIWIGERPFGRLRGEVWDGLSVLFHYRTGLILGEDRPYSACWQLAQRLFPNWVGFHPSRCKPSRRYTLIYRAGQIATLRCLREIEREIGREEQ